MIAFARVEISRYTLQLAGNSIRPVCVRHVGGLNHNGFGRYMEDKSMIEKAVAHKDDCDDPQHDKHLCYLMYEGFHFQNPEAYKELVQDAHFRCQQCGRTARSRDSLCMPEGL